MEGSFYSIEIITMWAPHVAKTAITKRKKSGHGGRRDGAGRKPGRALAVRQRMAIGAMCEAVARARRRSRTRFELTKQKGMVGFSARPIGKHGESIRAEIIASVIPWSAYIFGIDITASMVNTCWLEYRALKARSHGRPKAARRARSRAA